MDEELKVGESISKESISKQMKPSSSVRDSRIFILSQQQKENKQTNIPSHTPPIGNGNNTKESTLKFSN